MFEQFPKHRPPLPGKLEELYSSYYKSNREGETTASFLSQKLESWLHKKVAMDMENVNSLSVTTLEIGAGTLNQLQYELDSFSYDIVEPLSFLYCDSVELKKIRNIYSDISKVPDGSEYDRITSIATLEHICNLPKVIATTGLLLSEKGVLRVSIPSEGTFLWGLGWRLTTGLEFRLKYGIDYGHIMRHEHVNSAKEVEGVLKYFYEDVRESVFGISKTISLYQFYECSKPILDRCIKYSA